MLKSVPNFDLTKKSFHCGPKKWFDGTLYHSFTFSFNSDESKYFWGVGIFYMISMVVDFLNMHKCPIIPLVSLEAWMCIKLCAFSGCWCNSCLCESVTIVPIDERNLLCRIFTKSLFRLYLWQLPFNILTLYDQLTFTLFSASVISINTWVTLKSYLPDISMKMSPFCCVMSNSVSDSPDCL